MKYKLKSLIESNVLPMPNFSVHSDSSMLMGIGINESVGTMESFIKMVSEGLRGIKVNYSLSGAIAANFYSRKPRNTSDIDLIFHYQDKRKIVPTFEDMGFIISEDMQYIVEMKHPKYKGYSVDLMFASGDPEESAIELAKEVKIFGNKFMLMAGEFLVWMLLLSDRDKHIIDIENILSKPKSVDIGLLKKYLVHDQDYDAITKLNRLIRTSNSVHIAESYNNRMKNRVNSRAVSISSVINKLK